MKIKIVTHYFKEDDELAGDYVAVEVFVDDKLVREYGDHYHEEGSTKAEAFVDGIQFLQPDAEVTEVDVADYEG